MAVMPTAAQIAEEAGYSTRSIFERFADLDALSLATADHAIVRGQAEAVARDVDGDRPTRIRSHVETRAFACEKWLPLWRIITRQDQIDEPEDARCPGAPRQYRAHEGSCMRRSFPPCPRRREISCSLGWLC